MTDASDILVLPWFPAASGDVQTYQIRAAPASTIAPGVVMASSPALPTQGATEEVTRKREVRLMKNRYQHIHSLNLFFFIYIYVVLSHKYLTSVSLVSHSGQG